MRSPKLLESRKVDSLKTGEFIEPGLILSRDPEEGHNG